jgi:hypothetical protein
VTTAAVFVVSTPTPASFFARLGETDTQFTVAHVVSIEHANRFLRFHLIAHFHKSETLRPTAVAIFDECHRSYGSCLREQGP